MSLLIKSMFVHMRKHLFQTILTVCITILITGMLSVLFHFASSFQQSLRSYALEENGDYHYKYTTYAGTGVADLFVKMKERFVEDNWFSSVELIEDKDEVSLILTVSHPGLFTSKKMYKKFDEIKTSCYKETDEIFYLENDHNYELLASYGDLSRENGIYSFLVVFIVLLMTISVTAFLILSAVFWVSAMQREREIALLSGIGAGKSQIMIMILIESFVYCLISIPAGYFLGIIVYHGIQKHIDNIIYSLFQFPPADLVISKGYSMLLFGCAVCIILFSGLKSGVRVSGISPIDNLHRTNEIQVQSRGRRTKGSVYDYGRQVRTENCLAKKSYQRFKRRNRPILIMLAVTITLCFLLNGFKQYATEVIDMDYDTVTYNFSIDLYSDDKEGLYSLSENLQQLSENQLVAVKEAVFYLHSPYPYSEFGEAYLQTNTGMLPDVSLLCIDETDFNRICEELDIQTDESGIWGIFLNTDRSWWTNGVKVKGKPFEVAAGEKIQLYDSPDSYADEEKIVLNIAGIYDESPVYTEITESNRMQILVPEAVFSMLETKRLYLGSESGIYHISLRGNIGNGNVFAKIAQKQMEEFPEITYQISDYEEEIKRDKSGIESFEFLCEVLIGIFVFICICGNFTISWAINKTREREFATFLAVGMSKGSLQKMRLYELIYNVFYAFLPGALAGICSYQLIYWIYTSEYQISWHFPLLGLALGIGTLVLSVGIVELFIRIGNRKVSLADRLRTEE